MHMSCMYITITCSHSFVNEIFIFLIRITKVNINKLHTKIIEIINNIENLIMLVFLVFLKWRAISLIGTSGGFKLALHACNSHFPGSHSQLKEVLRSLDAMNLWS